MLQIVLILVGIVAIVMATTALKGEVQLSRTKTLTGGTARVVGIILIVFGVASIGAALIGIPLLSP